MCKKFLWKINTICMKFTNYKMFMTHHPDNQFLWYRYNLIKHWIYYFWPAACFNYWTLTYNCYVRGFDIKLVNVVWLPMHQLQPGTSWFCWNIWPNSLIVDHRSLYFLDEIALHLSCQNIWEFAMWYALCSVLKCMCNNF